MDLPNVLIIIITVLKDLIGHSRRPNNIVEWNYLFVWYYLIGFILMRIVILNEILFNFWRYVFYGHL